MPVLVVAFVSDLMFVPRIEHAAESLGYRVAFLESPEQVQALAPGTLMNPPAPRRPGEQTHGISGALLDWVSSQRPALLVFDLGDGAIPWREWLPLLKSAPATRRIPVLCFGSHVHVDVLQAARAAGADEVVARSRFTSHLPALLEKWARQPDYAAIAEACQEQLSPLGHRGLEEFNHGQYFEAHETLEAAWNAEHGVGREFYRAVLQIAVAYLQIERGNYNGAVKMFWRLRQWIEPLPDVCRGVDIRKLREDAAQVYATLLELGPERIAEFDRALLKPVRYREI